MRNRLLKVLFPAMIFAFAIAFIGCSSSSDDDDDSGGGSPYSDQCDKVAQCGIGGDLGFSTMDDCYSYFASSPEDAECAGAAASCGELSDCFDITDDDDDDNDTADDDTETTGKAPVLSEPNFVLAAADPDFPEVWNEWKGSTFDPEWERAGWYIGWRDTDNDLGGGKQFILLDEDETYESDLAPTLASLGSFDDFAIGIEFTDDFAVEGAHKMEVWVTDSNGNESNHYTVNYTVGSLDTSMGQPFADFTLRGFQKTPVKDGTGTFSDYALADYAGKIVVIDSFAGWCPPCNAEAPELDALREQYSEDDLVIFSMMQEDYLSGAVEDADLENWTIYNYGSTVAGSRSEQLTGIILNDNGAAVCWPYYPASYVPTNIILDKNHIVRFKMSGWYKPYAEDVIDALLAE